MEPPRKLLVVKPSALGDVVQSVGVVREIRRAWPAVDIGWLVNREFAPLLEPLSFLNRVHAFDRSRIKGLGGFLRSRSILHFLIKEMRDAGYDAVLDLQGLFRSGWLAKASGAKRRIGFADGREFSTMFYSEKVRTSRDIHAVERYLKALEKLGIQPQSRPRTDLEVRDSEKQRAQALAQDSPSPVVLCPGARWPSKIWPAERWAALADALADATGRPCVLAGGASEQPLAAAIQAFSKKPALDLTGRTTLRELAALLTIARLAVTNDSGPMHMAAAQGAPLIALFGPTDPVLTGPWGSMESVIRAESPPDDPTAYRRISDDSIMRRIEAAVVIDAALERLARAGSPGQSSSSASPA